MQTEEEINQIIYENRMLFEPWMESAEDFKQFMSKLRERGYTNIPISDSPAYRNPKEKKNLNIKSGFKRKVMLQKK